MTPQVVGRLVGDPEPVQDHPERGRAAVRGLPASAILLGPERHEQPEHRTVEALLRSTATLCPVVRRPLDARRRRHAASTGTGSKAAISDGDN